MKKLFLTSLTLLTAFLSQAGVNDVSLGMPAYGGTGCPAGSASAALSPDAKSLSILFDLFVVQAGQGTNATVGRKSCNVAIPVHVPQGYSVSVFKIDYRGFNALPAGAMSQFGVEYFFAGSRGPSYSKTFVGNLNDNYLLSNSLTGQATIWSDCGKDVILRTNASIMVKTNTRNEQTMSTLDSADIKAGLVYSFSWRRC